MGEPGPSKIIAPNRESNGPRVISILLGVNREFSELYVAVLFSFSALLTENLLSNESVPHQCRTAKK